MKKYIAALIIFASVFVLTRSFVLKHLICARKIVNVSHCHDESPYCVATLDNGKEVILESPQVGHGYECRWQ